MPPAEVQRLEYELEQFIKERLAAEHCLQIEDESGNEWDAVAYVNVFDTAIESLARDIIREFVTNRRIA